LFFPLNINNVIFNKFSYQGNWTSGTGYSSSLFLNGTVSFSRTSGDNANFMFTGNNIQVYGPKQSSAGIVGFMIDDGPQINIDQYSATPLYHQLIFDSGVQSTGSHVLTIIVTGQHNRASTDNLIWIDYVVLTPRS